MAGSLLFGQSAGAQSEEVWMFDQTSAGIENAATSNAPATIGPLGSAVEELESKLIGMALSQAAGNKAKAAALLDISERTLWYKLKKRGEESGDGN